jgi:hypothetical protein
LDQPISERPNFDQVASTPASGGWGIKPFGTSFLKAIAATGGSLVEIHYITKDTVNYKAVLHILSPKYAPEI